MIVKMIQNLGNKVEEQINRPEAQIKKIYMYILYTYASIYTYIYVNKGQKN